MRRTRQRTTKIMQDHSCIAMCGALFAPGRMTPLQAGHEPERPAAAHLSGADRDGGSKAPGVADPGCRWQGCSQRQAGRPGRARAGALAAGLQAVRDSRSGEGPGRGRPGRPGHGLRGGRVAHGRPWRARARAERRLQGVCERGTLPERARGPGPAARACWGWLRACQPGSGHVQGTLLTDSGHGLQACASPIAGRNTRHSRSRLSGGAGAPAKARPRAPAAARRRARPACRSATSAPLPPGPRPRPPACARARAVRGWLGFKLIPGSTN